jgi:hypothetical protein
MLVKENYVAESGHWYCAKTGEPRYTIVGKNGKERGTTLRDAREYDLVPSVTTILSQIAKPGLTTWLNQQLLMAALTLPKIQGETEEDWLNRIMIDSKSQSKEASQRGTDIHAVIQSFYEGVYLPEYPQYVAKTNQALIDSFGPQQWVSEQSFAHATGFGGKVDLHAQSGFVVDVKTTEKDIDTIKPYHEHLMQLSAYRNGLNIPMARCANVYVNAITNQVKVIEHSESDLEDAWECFQYLLMFYKRKNRL